MRACQYGVLKPLGRMLVTTAASFLPIMNLILVIVAFLVMWLVLGKVPIPHKSFSKVVLQKSIPTQIRQHTLHISNSKGQVDGFVGEFTLQTDFKNSLCEMKCNDRNQRMLVTTAASFLPIMNLILVIVAFLVMWLVLGKVPILHHTKCFQFPHKSVNLFFM